MSSVELGAGGGCYTLLADDSSAFASVDAQCRPFKAHVVLNTILNGGIVFSDNQVLCSRNLRLLAREDDLIRVLFREGFLGMAIRCGYKPEEPEGIISMEALHAAFIAENKIRHAETDFTKSPELIFIERHARKLPWDYNSIRSNFTEICQRLLFEQFGRLYNGDSRFEIFRQLILTEREKATDDGLGRAYLQNSDRLPAQMTEAGLPVDANVMALLKQCTDAPYVSNLPSVMGLSPIYSQEHSTSFDLLRGVGREYRDVEEPLEARMRLEHSHFVEGLNWLTLDDILFLHGCAERKAYRALVESLPGRPDRINDVALAYVELNMRIEDRILNRRPELRVTTRAPERRKVRKQIAVAIDYAGAALEATDCIALDWDVMGPFKFSAVMGVKVVFDLVKGWIEGDDAGRPFRDHAQYEIEKRNLAAYLAERGQEGRLNIDERVLTTSSFDRETIIR